MDGDRVNNSKMMKFLIDYKEDAEIIFIKTPLSIIHERLPDCNKQFVKTTETKTINRIGQYSSLGFKIIKIETKAKGGLFGY